MQRCENCGETFSWGKIYKSLWSWLYRPIKCENCHTKHKITFPSRIKLVSMTILPMILFTNYFSPFHNFFVTLSIGLTIFLVGSLLAPYAINYKVLHNSYE